jgi:tRNA pseudouridine38-40 synthase
VARVALKLGYLGTDFEGYARQPGLRTVEGDLLRALEAAKVIRSPNEFRTGSRTDKGVSAVGNVVSVDTEFDPATIGAAINSRLNGAWLWGWREVPAEFNPRYAKRRRYSYSMPDPGNVDSSATREALETFVGEHDFTAFARLEPNKDPVRTVARATLRTTRGSLRFEFAAPNFLWHQVRRMVAASLAVGRGDAAVSQLEAALHDPRKGKDWGLAPAENLVLEEVDYGFRFHVDERAARIAAKRVRDLWQEAAARERFLRTALRTFGRFTSGPRTRRAKPG